MNYQRIYDSIIEKAINSNRKKEKGGVYYEKHHIIPKCMGGSNEKSNLVLLTFKEHYLSHKLLYILYKNTIYEKALSYAFYRMNLKGNHNEVIFSGKYYEEVRLAFCKNQSEKAKERKGKKHTEETKNKIREARKNYKPTKETNKKIKDSFTDERKNFLAETIINTRKNNPSMILNRTKTVNTPEFKIKMSNSIKKAYENTPELRDIVGKRFSKKVINLITFEIFDSIKLAALKEGISYGVFKRKLLTKTINYDYYN